jgi:hypothetical protein
MRALKWIVILAIAYVGLVVAFESMLGYLQPAGDGTLVITATDDAGDSNGRVVSRLEHDGRLYVAANHWPRAWYENALENPQVTITLDGVEGDYLAVPVRGQEHTEVDAANSLPLMFRFVTGFPPRYFIRLDPR